MAEYAVMPMTDYRDICDAAREKAGHTGDIVSGELGEIVRSIDTQEDLTSELSTQDTLIANIMTALEGKAAGGGGGGGKAIVSVDSYEAPALLHTPSGVFLINHGGSTGWRHEYEVDVGSVCVLIDRDYYSMSPSGVWEGYEDAVLYSYEYYEDDRYNWYPGVLVFRVGENGVNCWIGYR